MFDLTGKNALITGASGGIGGEIAKALHGAGATVGLSGTRVEPLEALAAELGERAHVLPCNLSDAEAVDALPKQAADAMGSVDILVNNAGIQHTDWLSKLPSDMWESILSVNLSAAFYTMQAAMPEMANRGYGRVINIASVHGLVASKQKAPYVAAKHGLIGL
ncbi:MAG TPA: beta-ketoacyl-ACP reductase, partial [Octadecabacter sp.]|nr:beta-ketoacyl-ACP reductase [Octadecabacter sp.]